MTLEATSEVLASCGDNVTMTCNATSTQKLDIKLFAWYDSKRNVCQHDSVQPDPDTVLCESSAEASHHRLTLTLINVMPVNEGKYLCKLQSMQGVKSTTTVLTVQSEPPLFVCNVFILPLCSAIFLKVFHLYRLP